MLVLSFSLTQVQAGIRLGHLAGAIWTLAQEGSWPRVLLENVETGLADLLLTLV